MGGGSSSKFRPKAKKGEAGAPPGWLVTMLKAEDEKAQKEKKDAAAERKAERDEDRQFLGSILAQVLSKMP